MDASGSERAAQSSGEVDRIVTIAMQAERVAAYADSFAIKRIDMPRVDDRKRLSDSHIDIFDHRAGRAARSETGVGQIATIGKRFMCNLQPGTDAGARQLAVGQADENQLIIEIAYDGGDRVGELPIVCGLVVQGAMRFDVDQSNALGFGQGTETLQLLANLFGNFGWLQLQNTPAKMLAIGIARMGAGRDTGFAA